MANRNLNSEELDSANDLLDQIRAKLESLAGNDAELLFAYRRKIYKELTYDERGKPTARRKLKEQKRVEQNNLCSICNEPLPLKYAVLDRFNAAEGYTSKNTRLIHQDCDTKVQESRGYA